MAFGCPKLVKRGTGDEGQGTRGLRIEDWECIVERDDYFER